MGARVFILWGAVLLVAAALGCDAAGPRPCTVECSTQDECPNGTTCDLDGYCYGEGEQPGTCLFMPDGGDEEPDARADARQQPDAGEGPDGSPDARPPDAGALSFAEERVPFVTIPDDTPGGVEDVIVADVEGLLLETVEVHLEIDHSWRGDLVVTLRSPLFESAPVLLLDPMDDGDDVRGTFQVTGFTPGTSAEGAWALRVEDLASMDIGTFESWSIGINRAAP